MAGSHTTKRLIIVRHGQAQHNPRAEVAKDNGCSMEEFFALMREDDVLDARLTEIGKEQAQAARLANDVSESIQLVVSSTLSRAIETADHVIPPSSSSHERISLDIFREVSGDMLNAKRRTRTELSARFPAWSFDAVAEEDGLWTPEMENLDDAAERGYLGLKWLLERPEENILLVSHGGILRYLMERHPLIVVRDARSLPVDKPAISRFGNCEMRNYRIAWGDPTEEGSNARRTIVLTQVDDSRSTSVRSA